MKRTILVRRPLAAAAVTAGVSAGPLAPLAHAGPSAPDVPGAIAVGAGNKPFLVGHASGVQIYTCNTVAGGFSWSSATPRADL
jgi:hypothetical protein